MAGRDVEVEDIMKEAKDIIAGDEELEEAKLQLANEEALLQAAQDGDEEKVEEMIKAGTKLDCRDGDRRTALHIAADCGSKGVVEMLIRRNADVNSRNGDKWTPLHVAAYNGHEAVRCF